MNQRPTLPARSLARRAWQGGSGVDSLPALRSSREWSLRSPCRRGTGTDRAFAPAPTTEWSACSMLPNGAEAVVLRSSTRPSQTLATALKGMNSVCVRTHQASTSRECETKGRHRHALTLSDAEIGRSSGDLHNVPASYSLRPRAASHSRLLVISVGHSSTGAGQCASTLHR